MSYDLARDGDDADGRRAWNFDGRDAAEDPVKTRKWTGHRLVAYTCWQRTRY